ncbi:carbamoyltransferase [Azoarcus indigens]|uniref:Carbamoyltransferase n=1 Tax=Azoarcus indigens TaxID=29545 RepID=A0A4R6DTE2_9RHOO|nr:carbamoyltransferase [Azoarcus indigens]NMG64487.1 carbamoyltransferase [Azoarcus indigens]TDN48426.1 carbamoyltransferase [Azoarcus indigens]
MYTLGINAAFHDSAACLVHDGSVVAAAEEERFSRIKHAKRPVPFSAWELPFSAIDYCLAEAGIRLDDVDQVAYSFDPAQFPGRSETTLLTLPLEPSAVGVEGEWNSPWDPLFLSYVINAPRQLMDGAPHHLRDRFENLAAHGGFRWNYVEHHLAHEASAFLAAPFEEAAVLTLDGRGERATTTLGVWRGGSYERLRQIDFPHSLGLLYEEVTRYLGFQHASDEYKVMALASYGKPRHLDLFRDMLVWDGDGGFTIAPLLLENQFGPPRRRGTPLEERHYDVAASLQVALEETVLHLADWLHKASGQRRLCMAGGVALNCVMNARLRDHGPYEEVWVQPAAGDAGTALGAALWVDYKERGQPRQWAMEHANLGPGYGDDTIEAALKRARLPYTRLDDVAGRTAGLLADGKVVGWFQGRMEFGPRALGARSILASPLDAGMQARLNELKDREDFRPVAPSVPEEDVAEWFSCERDNPGRSPFMLFVYDVTPDKARRIPAAVHVDGTARVQTVSAATQPRYHALLRAFGRRTGVPVLINTSFNVRGEPIVCTPRDAIAAFFTSPIDALVIGSFLVEKQP